MKRNFAIGAAWTAAASWIEQAAGALIFITIANLVGVEAFGIAAMAFAFLFLGEYLVRDTVTESIVERKSLEDGRLEATFATLVGFALVIVAVLAVVAHIAAALYAEPSVAPLLISASPTVLMIALAGVPTALLRRKLAYRVLAIRSIIGVVSGGIVGIVMALNGFGAWSLVGQRVTEIGINSLFAFTAAGWMPKHWPRRADFALLRGLGPKVVLLRTTTLAINQTPTVILGIVADPRAAGLFAFAWRLAEMVLFLIIKPLQGVAQSALAEVRRRSGSTTQFYLDLTELAAFGGFAAYAGLALIANPLTVLLLGPDWRDAGAILPFLCLAGAVITLTAIQEAYLLATDQLHKFLSAAFVEAVIGVAIIALASPFGILATAAAVAARALIVLPLRTRAALAPEAIAPRCFVQTLMPPLAATLGMAAAVSCWRVGVLGHIPDIAFVASAVTVGVAVFCALIFGFMPNTVARLRTFTQAE